MSPGGRTIRRGFLGLLAGRLIGAGRPQKPGPKDLRKAEFPTATQTLGVRFTERIREVFRFRWIRRS